MALEEGDIVLCTVDRIEGTNVFVNIEGDGQGSIMTSEIAPGRIRNIRDYVVPKKKIVCKVLKVFENRVDLSLRRVTPKEQKEVLEHYSIERSYASILNTILKEKAEQTIKKILGKGNLYDFFEEVKSNPKKLEEVMSKEHAEKILEIVNAQKQKKFEIKREISLSTIKPNGMELIKEIFSNINNVEIKYISAGHYSLKAESSDIKTADNILKNIIADIEKNSKKFGVEFSILEK